MKKSIFSVLLIIVAFAGAFLAAPAIADVYQYASSSGFISHEGLTFSAIGFGLGGMTTLAANAPRDYHIGDFHDFPVIAADIIYQGAAVGDNGSGYARPLVAGDPFRGFAEIKADNAAGIAGDVNVRCKTRGRIKLAISALAITDVGKDVYASDDDTFTLTQSTNTRIGHVVAWLETGYGLVEFDVTSGVVVELTDSTTGTADNTLADVGAAFSQATLNNNFADLAAKVNYLIRRLGN